MLLMLFIACNMPYSAGRLHEVLRSNTDSAIADLVRRKMPSVWCEYFISLIQSLDSVNSRWPRFHLTFVNEM